MSVEYCGSVSYGYGQNNVTCIFSLWLLKTWPTYSEAIYFRKHQKRTKQQPNGAMQFINGPWSVGLGLSIIKLLSFCIVGVVYLSITAAEYHLSF